MNMVVDAQLSFWQDRWFRLMHESKHVGYMRYEKNDESIFSIDNYGWSTSPIDYDRADSWTGCYDRNNRPLFEHDIVAMRITMNPEPKKTVFNCV